jgi:SAM-dependent methyltransferase
MTFLFWFWVAITALLLVVAGVVTSAALRNLVSSEAPWVPTGKRGISGVVELVGDLPDGARVVDLGSGDGRLLQAIVVANAKSTGVGVERSRILSWMARGEAKLQRCGDRLRFLCGNFYDAPLEEYSVVLCYLWPAVMGRLAPKFQTDLQPGTRIISVTFAIPDWEPYRTVDVPKFGTLYEYRIPERS